MEIGKKSVWAAVMAAALACGCGNNTNNAVTDGSETSLTGIEECPAGTIVVGFAQVGSESDWRTANTQSFLDVFTEENGYYLIYEDGQQKQENQVKALRNFILQDVDYIVLDPIGETGWDSVLQEAKEAGIPVILSDRSVEVKDDELYTCWVGSDFVREGRMAGEWLEDFLKENGREEDEILMVTLQGTLDSSAHLGRAEGFAGVMEKHGNWNMLAAESGDFTQARAQEVMEEFLHMYPDIDVVICENDNMAFGAVDAIRQYGKIPGAQGDMLILSFDAVDDAFDYMERGEIAVDIECNPISAPVIEQTIRKLEKGEKVEKMQFLEETFFDYTMDLEKIRKSRSY